MCDGYAQSTQHARTVAWMESSALPAWLSDDANSSNSDRESRTNQRAGRVDRKHASNRPLQQAALAAGAQGLPVGQSPVGQ